MLDVTRLLFKDGIQLNGLPASPAEFTDAYLPFHPAGRPFHRSQPHPRRLNTSHHHLADGRFVSVPEPRLSPYALYEHYSSARWAEFPQVLGTRSRPPAHQPNLLVEMVGNKNFGTSFQKLMCVWFVQSRNIPGSLSDLLWCSQSANRPCISIHSETCR